MSGVAFLKERYRSWGIDAPRIHIVLGSAIAGALEGGAKQSGWEMIGELKFSHVPGLHQPGAPGHAGSFQYYRHKQSKRVACFQLGRLHGYEGHSPKEVVLPVMQALAAGTRNFILTNAAGGLRVDMESGSVMLIRDHVNLTGQNPLVGPNPIGLDGQALGPRFPDLSKAYDREMRSSLRPAMEGAGLTVNEGVYLGLLGPSFETPAEIALFARWGLDAVGMSTVWEAIALNHAGARVAGFSLISNPGCGLTDTPLCHEDILVEMQKASVKIIDGLFRYLESGNV